jgi:putative membrane-bound dehydrogenase-like protein
MRPHGSLFLLSGTLIVFCSQSLLAEPPKTPVPTDPHLTVELVAMEPDIRTPTSVQVDQHGRIWVLENNTHFRPKSYTGPASDRVLILDDFGPNGRARKITVWADGFRDGMSLLVLPNGAGTLVSTRSGTIRFRDIDGDGIADERTAVLRMQTKTEYPHNGLSGLAMGPDGKIYLGLGENFGNEWILTGSDDVELRGADEGAIFRFNPDGTGLEWFALGVWNPFGITVRPDGQIFAVDNDPSGGSLCRLLHVVRGGDYGYRYRYGRTTDHPFLAWFGQIPGTLPPVCLVGEAPCGIVTYKRSGLGAFPAEYDGQLIGTTWSDHAIQRYPLEQKGVSFVSKPETIVKGDHFFRPTGIAQAPDGSLVVGDWADGEYEVHGKGRIWRIRRAQREYRPQPALAKSSPAPTSALQSLLNGSASREKIVAGFSSEDPFIFHGAVLAAAEERDIKRLSQLSISRNAKERLGALLAMRKARIPEAAALLPRWLSDDEGAVRRAALQWITEEKRVGLQPQLARALEGLPSRTTFQAYLATIQMLESGQPDPKATTKQTAEVALDPKRAPELRALALRLLPTGFADLKTDTLAKLTADESPEIQVEAVRILAARPEAKAQAELRRIATGDDKDLAAEAIAGLALSSDQPATASILRRVVANDDELTREAQRSLGTAAPASERLDVTALLALEGNPAAGRRLFFHPNGPRCYTCHTVEGRGTTIGPDLTQMGRFTPEQILEAIREPSKEIAPVYAQWHITMNDGQEAFGIDLFEDNKTTVSLLDATGRKAKYKIVDMVSREVLPISMMPPGLDATLTAQETRDLIEFLRERRD